MSSSTIKRVAALAACAALACLLCIGLVGCGDGKQVAATWENGEILEDDVTTRIENIRTTYGYDSSVDMWESFIKQKQYDSDAAASTQYTVDEDGNLVPATTDDSAEGSEDSEKTEGTVADMRSYVIEQIARVDVEKWEAKQRGLEVTDEDIASYVEEQRESVEAQYMKGTFESILQLQGYKDLEAYEDELKESLIVNKLEEAEIGCTEDDEDNWDQEKWDTYVDGLMEKANLQIKDMPSDLPYDPAVIKAAEESVSSSEATDAASDEAASTDAATSEDASAEGSSASEGAASEEAAATSDDSDKGKDSEKSKKSSKKSKKSAKSKSK